MGDADYMRFVVTYRTIAGCSINRTVHAVFKAWTCFHLPLTVVLVIPGSLQWPDNDILIRWLESLWSQRSQLSMAYHCACSGCVLEFMKWVPDHFVMVAVQPLWHALLIWSSFIDWVKKKKRRVMYLLSCITQQSVFVQLWNTFCHSKGWHHSRIF